MSYLYTNKKWAKRKKLLHDYSYIRDFVSFLREYNMLRQPNKNWTIYPTRNFKSNKNKRLHPTFIPQRLNINEIAKIRITKQDYITFHNFGIEFSESLLKKLSVQPFDRVILYINNKECRIGFKFYLNRVHKYHKNRDIIGKNTLNAIENNPNLFRDRKKDIIYGYNLAYEYIPWHYGLLLRCIIKVSYLIDNNAWIKLNTPYIPIFDYVHNRWEVKL